MPLPGIENLGKVSLENFARLDANSAATKPGSKRKLEKTLQKLEEEGGDAYQRLILSTRQVAEIDPEQALKTAQDTLAGAKKINKRNPLVNSH
jgi:hypothetical protein